MLIQTNIVFIWIGTVATIPAGWERETSLDDKYAKAWGVEDPNDTGGAATHQHTSPAHSHAVSAHVHTYTTNTVGNEENMRTGNGTPDISGPNHYHTGTSGAAIGSTSSDSLTYGSASNDPPHRKIIFIKPTIAARLPENIVALWNSNTAPLNWSKVTELQDRYLKGSSAGANADISTDNGSYTNVHDITHNHASASHYHATANSGTPQGNYFQSQGGPGAANCSVYHVHSVSFGSQSTAVNQYSGSLTTTETVEPAYSKLQAIKKAAIGKIQRGLIALWLGAIADIPGGWVPCDGGNGTKDLRDKYIKIGNPADANGGSNTHTHGAQAHGHTGASHNGHAVGFSVDGNDVGNNSSASDHGIKNPHQHTLSGALSSATANWDNANTTADSSSNEPPYRVAAYIQLNKILSKVRMLNI